MPDGGGVGTEPILEVRDLAMAFALTRGLLRRRVGTVRAVDGVSFDLRRGETLGLVGESGCGKSTVTRCILRVHRPTAGAIRYRRPDGQVVDLAGLDEAALAPYRTDIRLVFQDPQGSLDPRLTVRAIVGEALAVNRLAPAGEIDGIVVELLRRVGLRPDHAGRYPHAFSGGERQRIGIARALATSPRLVVLDEAVSALDVSVRAQTLNLLRDLQAALDLTYLFVSHDLSVVQHISDRVAVMYVGRLVEVAPVDDLFARPRHPYTEALLSALPVADPDRARASRRIRLPGEVADPANRPAGCAFHPRCRFATDLCRTAVPALRPLDTGSVACHHADQLTLAGVEP